MMTSGPTNFDDSQSPEPSLEPDPSVLTAYLSHIQWGEDYPEELLVMSEKEQRILDQRQQGRSFLDIAKEEGISSSDLEDYHRAGVGKRELLASREVDIHALGPSAQKILVLNDIFGAGWLEKHSSVIQRDTSNLIEYVGSMDATFGKGWRTQPWLWTVALEGVQAKTETYDKEFGPDWRIYPGLLTSSVKTVLTSARALPYLGVTRQNTPSHTYYNLLTTRLSTRQKKIVFIRRAILRHTQIYNTSQKRSFSTLGARRARQTEAERQIEQEELAELREFIATMGAKCLRESTSAIATQAYNKGLYKEPEDDS
jgi:hypothetical protein